MGCVSRRPNIFMSNLLIFSATLPFRGLNGWSVNEEVLTMKFYELLALAVVGASFLYLFWLFVLASFHGFIVCVNTNSFGEHWLELSLMLAALPFMVLFFKEVK